MYTHTHGQISHLNDHHGPFNLTSSLLSSVLRLSRTFTFNDSLPVDDLFPPFFLFTSAAAGTLLALSHQLLEQIHALDPLICASYTAGHRDGPLEPTHLICVDMLSDGSSGDRLDVASQMLLDFAF